MTVREASAVVPVATELDVFAARRETRSAAVAIGFGSTAVAELVIASSELAWNIVKYAPAGDISLFAIDAAGGGALEIVARDRGPPFRDFDAAIVDGNDDRGPIDPVLLWRRRGIGGGLGAVLRFTDQLRCETAGGEKRIIAVRYVRP